MGAAVISSESFPACFPHWQVLEKFFSRQGTSKYLPLFFLWDFSIGTATENTQTIGAVFSNDGGAGLKALTTFLR